MGAWEELSKDERGWLWKRFRQQFHFRPSTHPASWPGIREPHPSVTYDISAVFSGDPVAYEEAEIDLNTKVLEALRRCVPHEEYLYALDWQHPCYRFRPHYPFDAADPDEWMVPVIPDGDYYIFLAKGFEFGIFGHPWEKTICVFGECLLDSVRLSEPTLFGTVLRST